MSDNVIRSGFFSDGIEKKAKSDPCWSGYEQVGMKNKGGKQVPNCVPSKPKKGGKKK